ncbi:MAG: hypothetical protein IKS03_03720 [Ruminococcus sp.]|nr:hypothetical protein [Ruminococcus sp.]
MGFWDGLLGVAGAAGLYFLYQSKYEDYDDEELFDEYVYLSKASRSGQADSEEEIRLQIIKLLMQQRGIS